ncbi:MAG: ATP-binding protein [Lachnospiraceae bacterium]|nr:ATP-binding protein [Lachnospiraceae bacterium]
MSIFDSMQADELKRVAFDQSPIGINLFDHKLNVIDCNQAALRLFEVSDKQYYIENFLNFFPETQPNGRASDEMAKEYREMTFNLGSAYFEWHFLKPDGESLPCEVTLIKVEQDDERAFLAYYHDLREHLVMLDEIERQDNLISSMNLAAMALLVSTSGEDEDQSLKAGMEQVGKCINANRVQMWRNIDIDGVLNFELLYEWSDVLIDLVNDMHIGEIYSYDTFPGLLEKLKSGEIVNSPVCNLSDYSGEILAKHGIKSVVWMPLFLEGRLWGSIVISDYYNERYFTEDEISFLRSAGLMLIDSINRMIQAEKIRDTETMAQLIIDTMPLACELWNREQEMLICNKSALTLYEIDNFKEYCEKFSSLSPPVQPNGESSAELQYTVIEQAFVEGYVYSEWMHRTLDGTPMPTEVVLVRVPFRDDYVVAAYTRDLRDQRKSENELHLAVEAAQAASYAKSAFLANMSHEIRTPMNSIIGFSELAMDDNISEKTRDYLLKIRNNSEWLLRIINDILDLSKIESGKLTLENTPFDLHDIFAHCKTTIMPTAVEKGLMLYFYAEPSLGKTLVGDPTRLRQVLINLLSNAVKFTRKGTVKVSSNILASTESTITLLFEVKDSGIGMSYEQIERIFDPFVQADSSTTRKFGGTGLGLTICRNIIELMGGQLTLDSTIGKGSKFSFTLTFNAIDEVEKKEIKQYTLSESEKPVFFGEILVCEDNKMNQKVISEHLSRVGIESVIANNGLEGINIIRNRKEEGGKPFDLIFMDIHMPVMDGLEAASALQKMNNQVPIVALTANIMSGDLEMYKSKGLPDYLGKPFTSKELWSCLLKYLQPLRIEAVDTAKAAGADAEFSRQIQTIFVKKNQTKFAEIENAVTSGDIKLAYRLAHTLKGNAGQIGESTLQAAALDVESRLKNEENNLTVAVMDLLKSELNRTLKKLAPLLQEEKREINTEFDKGKAFELFDKLEEMLENSNPDCFNLIDELKEVPFTEAIITQIEDFDFEPAIETLKELREKVKNYK